MKLYEATKDWEGATVAIIGNGPSLKGLDLSPLARHKVITTNNSYKLFPSSDVQMCSDRHWLKDYPNFIDEFKGGMIVVTRPEAVKRLDPRMVRMKTVKIWATQQPFICSHILAEGHTSVSTSISLSVLRGAKTILLFGVDLKSGPNGERRSTGDEPDNATAKARYKMMNDHFCQQAKYVKERGVEVLNCNLGSMLTAYPKISVEDGLCFRS